MKLMPRTLAVLLLLATAAFAQGPNRTVLPAPTVRDNQLYPPNADAKADIKAALEKAAREKKHVLIEFGAVWCYDCHVLDLAFKDKQIAPILDQNYVFLRVDVGRYDKNLDIAKQYKVPLEKGIPALAVLDGNGKLLFSHKRGDFQAARKLTFGDLSTFLHKWKPKAKKS